MEKNLYLLKKYYSAFQAGAEFTAFDTETTGLNSREDRIIEIGAVRFSKDGEISQFSQLIFPTILVPRFCTELTGITNKMLYGQPEFKDICDSFLEFSAGSTFIAHNCGFDVTFVNAELGRAGRQPLEAPMVPAIDTVRTARTAFPDLESYKLQSLAAHFCIPPGSAHRATDDARVCMELFLKCMEEFPEKMAVSRAVPQPDQ